MAWITAHWAELLVAILGVDRFLITLFPDNTILAMIASGISSILPKSGS